MVKNTKYVSIALFFIASFLSGQTVTFCSIPKRLQLFARDEHNTALVTVSGNVSGAGVDSVSVQLRKNGVVTGRVVQAVDNVAGGPFELEVTLTAELASYSIDIKAGSTTVATVDSLLCGDAFIGAGQSNMDYSNVAFSTPWLRTYGSQTSTSDSLWHNPGKSPYNIGRKIIEEQMVPVCIIIGSVGGTSIVSHQPDTTLSTIYGRLYQRVKRAGLLNGIKAIIWNQGEFDTVDSLQASTTYETRFRNMYEGWKQHYTGFRHVYTFQIHHCDCCGDWQGVLRETQRRIPEQYPDISAVATVGAEGHDGCHFLLPGKSGYAQMGDWLYPMVKRDLYSSADTVRITSPNVAGCWFVNGNRTEFVVKFDQPVTLPVGSLQKTFLFDNAEVQIDSTRADTSNSSITLFLHNPSRAQRFSYTPEHYYPGTNNRYTGPWLFGSNGLPAFTFRGAPIASDSFIMLDTSEVSLYVTSSGMIPADPVVRLANKMSSVPPITVDADSSWLGVSVSGTGNAQVIHHSVSSGAVVPMSVCTVGVRLSADGYKDYLYKVVVRDGEQKPDVMEVSPSCLWAPPGGQGVLDARVWDEFGGRVSTAPAVAWTIASGGSIDANGVFTSSGDTGTFYAEAYLVDNPAVRAVCSIKVSIAPYLPFVKRINFEPDTIPPRGGWFANNGQPSIFTETRGFGWVGASHFMLRDDRNGTNYLLKSFVSYTPSSVPAPYRISAPDGDYIIRTAMGDNAWGISERTWVAYGKDTICVKPSGTGNGIVTDTVTVRGGKGIDLLIKGAINYFVVIARNGVDMDMVADDSINVYVDSEKGTVAYNPDGITVRPNPFNPLTFVNVSLGKKSKTELNVYDVRGKIVATLFSGELDAGKHRYSWDAKAVAGGVYFVRLKSERKTLQLKVTLLR